MRRLSKCCFGHYNCNLQDAHHHVGCGWPPLPTFFYQATTFFSFIITLEVTNCNTHETLMVLVLLVWSTSWKRIGFLFAFNFYLMKRVKTLCDTSLLLKSNYLNKVIPDPLCSPCWCWIYSQGWKDYTANV
jgi:hypothetical protein